MILFSLLLVTGIGLTALRIVKKYQVPGPFDRANQGYCDFHNGVYFPSLATIEGVSPYGEAFTLKYPIERQIPFYSPAVLLVHAPWALLPLHVSEVIYFLLMIVMIFFVAMISMDAARLDRRWDILLAICCAIVFSRAGHVTLFTGYFTLEMVLGLFVAIHQAGRRPWLSAAALVLVTAKPTYILPFGLLMLARGNIRELVYGAILSLVVAAIPTLWLAWHEGQGDIASGGSQLLHQIEVAQEVHRADPIALPVNSWTRIDTLAIVAKWAGKAPAEFTHLVVMGLLLVVPMWLLNKRRLAGVEDGLAGVTGSIIMISGLVSIYHHSYDLLLIAAPVVGIVSGRLVQWKRVSFTVRMALATLMIFAAYNYLSAKFVLDRLSPQPTNQHLITSVNGVIMLIVLVAVCSIGMRSPTTADQITCDPLSLK